MDNQEILTELEDLYKKFRDSGDAHKAADVMTQIIAIQNKNETVETPKQNILLG